MVVDGETTLFLLTDGEETANPLSEGRFFVVPANTWHRFESPRGVKVMTVTPNRRITVWSGPRTFEVGRGPRAKPGGQAQGAGICPRTSRAKRAIRRAARRMVLDDRRVLAFATHGLAPGDLDGLDQPALALSPPPTGAGVSGPGRKVA